MTKAGAQVRIRFGVSKRANQFPIQRTHFIAQCSQIYTEKYKLFLFAFFSATFANESKLIFQMFRVTTNIPRMDAGIE